MNVSSAHASRQLVSAARRRFLPVYDGFLTNHSSQLVSALSGLLAPAEVIRDKLARYEGAHRLVEAVPKSKAKVDARSGDTPVAAATTNIHVNDVTPESFRSLLDPQDYWTSRDSNSNSYSKSSNDSNSDSPERPTRRERNVEFAQVYFADAVDVFAAALCTPDGGGARQRVFDESVAKLALGVGGGALHGLIEVGFTLLLLKQQDQQQQQQQHLERDQQVGGTGRGGGGDAPSKLKQQQQQQQQQHGSHSLWHENDPDGRMLGHAMAYLAMESLPWPREMPCQFGFRGDLVPDGCAALRAELSDTLVPTLGSGFQNRVVQVASDDTALTLIDKLLPSESPSAAGVLRDAFRLLDGKKDDFFFLHCVTSARAVLEIAAHLTDPEASQRLLRQWQRVLYCVYVAQGAPVLDSLTATEKLGLGPDDSSKRQALLLEKALHPDEIDEHLIKLAFVALDASTRGDNHSKVYVDTALRVFEVVQRSGYVFAPP